MEQYDKEFLEYMKNKYKLTLDKATNGTEQQIITFAVAWNIWKQAKNLYCKTEKEDIAEFMSKDHSRLDYIFQEFRKSKSTGESRQLFMEFEAGIGRHIKWEEEILFPLVRQKLGDDSPMIDELELQHRRIMDDLTRISANLKARDTGIETDLERLLAGHDKMEEEGIYQWIDAYIDDKAKRAALSRMR